MSDDERNAKVQEWKGGWCNILHHLLAKDCLPSKKEKISMKHQTQRMA